MHMCKKYIKYIQYAALAVSAGMILLGITRGEAEIVLNKAVNICFECIGLG